MMDLIREVYERAGVVWSGRYQTTVNELTDQLPALRPRVLWEAALRLVQRGTFDCDKILCEEDKGFALGAVVSLITGLPLAVARQYTYEPPGAIKVPVTSEYMSGTLYVNGIESGDRVSIVDDTISTGGTLLALIEAVQRAGATVSEVLALVEKVDNGGVERIERETGITVFTCVRITITDGRVRVHD